MWLPNTIAGQTVYLDANILIYGFETQTSPLQLSLTLGAVLRLFQEERAWARTSALTRAEVMVRPLRDSNAELLQLYQELLSGNAFLAVDAISGAMIDQAARLRARLGLRLADALHVASAMESGCDAFLTADRQLAVCGNDIEVLLLADLTSW
jgi:predicted nucleic acid-binding protein